VRSAISIRGISARGRHGANPGEQAQAQEFAVDVEVWVDVGKDSLTGTLDYRTIVDTARNTVGETSFTLLESLAEAVAAALIGLDLVLRATVVVHKPRAAKSLGVADISAEVTLNGP